jgi:hypothetical protein
MEQDVTAVYAGIHLLAMLLDAVLLFLLQGVLAMPEARHLYPALLGVLVAMCLFAEGLGNPIRLRWQRNHPTARGGRRL